MLQAQNTAFVVDNLAGQVQVIDLGSKRVAGSIPAGSQCSELLILPDNRHAIVSNYGDNNVSVIDLQTNLRVTAIPTGQGPGSLANSPDGRFVYVANDISNDVTVIDVAARAAVATIPVGVSPVQVNMSPSGLFAYALNQDDGTVSVIDTNRNRVAKALTVGTRPNQFAILPKLNNAYVVNTGSNNVSVVNLTTHEVTGTIAAGRSPVTVAFSSDSKTLYVVNRDSNDVSVIDTGSNREIAKIPLGSQPVAMVVTFDNRYGFVSNRGSNNISLIDLQTRTLELSIGVGAGPFSLMLDPDENFLYVTNLGPPGTVSVIDVNADKVAATIPSGGTPVQFEMRNAPVLLEIAPNPVAAGKTIVLGGDSFVPGATVRFETVNPPRTVSVNPTFLDSQGLEVTVPSLASAAGAVVDVLHPDGSSSERIALRLGTTSPAIFAGGVVEGAGFARAPAPISGGSFLSVFGSFPGMGEQSAGAYPIPTTLGNAVVTFNGVPAPLYATIPAAGQINLVAPIRLLAQRQARVAVTVGAQTSPVEIVNVAPVSPGIFTDFATGAGAFLHADYSLVTAASPARKGETIALFLTGLGNTDPPWIDGEQPATDVLTHTSQTPAIIVAGQAATIRFSGLAPCCSGLYQVNFDVPGSAPSAKDVPVSATIGGRISNSVKLAVQ